MASIETTVVVAGTVADFTEQVQLSMRSKIAQTAGVSTDAVSLSISPASVILNIVVEFDSVETATSALAVLSTSLADAESASAFLSTDIYSVQVESILSTPSLITQPSLPPLPPSLPPPTSDDDDSSLPMIIGIVVGSVVGVLLLGAAAVMWYRRGRSTPSLPITTPKATAGKAKAQPTELRGIELRDQRSTGGSRGGGRGNSGPTRGRGGRGPYQPSPRTTQTQPAQQPQSRRTSSVELRPTRDQRLGRGAPVRVDPRLGNVTTEKAKSTAALQGARGNHARFNRT